MVLFAKLLVLALTAAATPILRRDAATVENDITQQIGPQIATLNSDVNGFPASGSTGAENINSDFGNLIVVINHAISDIKAAGSFGTLSGTSILAAVQELLPSLSDTLVAIEAQEPSWAAIPGGTALVLKDLQSLNTVFYTFANALIASEPILLKAAAVAVQAQLSTDFDTAIAAYSV
ncbi:uncharacterized protein BHQ10_001900 [Talaromyces amestolkiae]|uniref:Hydrophobic surface binding protein A n=1 Tax=Talaromyces amestolkiae TaxID=1196081 RepID=A0A364KQR1_TALAM|nr:uncharacterized protein BHQ10_001900 [Talaromyces amestolkiae]RAO65888.1 hypothetical protein BHQ10_001900 [Talaromyces amestolkiae]